MGKRCPDCGSNIFAGLDGLGRICKRCNGRGLIFDEEKQEDE